MMQEEAVNMMISPGIKRHKRYKINSDIFCFNSIILFIIDHYRVLVYDPVKPVCERPYIVYEMEKRKKVESHLSMHSNYLLNLR
jgi:hypothetical protein